MSAVAREDQAQEAPTGTVLIRKATVLKKIDACNASLYRWMMDGSINFPKPVKLGKGPRAPSRWIESEIDAWIAGLEADRDAEVPK